MAQYKVPQDVEADDKLIGPFSFRQFIYLLIAAGLVALAVGLFQIFPLLAIIPLPFIILFVVLALPLKKDQPMETYLAALITYYLKPHKRIWTPGQRESTITITAPKIVDDERARNLTGEEATHRISFLADIVDSEGRAINNTNGSNMNDEIVAEANTTDDMFETNHFNQLENTIANDENKRHEEVIRGMQEAIKKNDELNGSAEVVKHEEKADTFNIPELPRMQNVEKTENEEKTEKAQPESVKSSIIELANNTDYTVDTIAKEANRIKEKEDGEVFISLH
ncbi:PrgI family protein [Candidatus Saccharibacteria bacterium]|nr:PrgI family protein [Candidatus Saccharibacteria bacterium]